MKKTKKIVDISYLLARISVLVLVLAILVADASLIMRISDIGVSSGAAGRVSALARSAELRYAGSGENYGGRLHNHFDGENKYIYVENFGNEPIFVRIMLTEYMEIDGVPLLEGTTLENTRTWRQIRHGVSNFYEHWTIGFGGRKYFMPTFNRDHYSHSTEMSGWAEFAENAEFSSRVRDSSVKGNDPGTFGGCWGAYGREKPGVLIETNPLGNAHPPIKRSGYMNVSQSTIIPSGRGYMTMTEWINRGRNPGNFWVLDGDGWAYWAAALPAGEATSLLVSGIERICTPENEWYYAIHAAAEFVNLSGLDMFGYNSTSRRGIVSNNARILLREAAMTVRSERFTIRSSELGRAIVPGTTVMTLTSPVGNATQRFFNICSGESQVWSITQNIIGGTEYAVITTNGSSPELYTGELARGIRLEIPIGFVGMITLTAGRSVDFTINVVNNRSADSAMQPGETFEASGIEWRVLARRRNEALIISEHILFNEAMFQNGDFWDEITWWGTSELSAFLDGAWFDNLCGDFRSSVIPQTIHTRLRFFLGWQSGYRELQNQNAFLLSEEEVFGTAAIGNADMMLNVFGDLVLFPDNHSRKMQSHDSVGYWLLRSPMRARNTVAGVNCATGDIAGIDINADSGIRPSLVIGELTPSATVAQEAISEMRGTGLLRQLCDDCDNYPCECNRVGHRPRPRPPSQPEPRPPSQPEPRPPSQPEPRPPSQPEPRPPSQPEPRPPSQPESRSPSQPEPRPPSQPEPRPPSQTEPRPPSQPEPRPPVEEAYITEPEVPRVPGPVVRQGGNQRPTQQAASETDLLQQALQLEAYDSTDEEAEVEAPEDVAYVQYFDEPQEPPRIDDTLTESNIQQQPSPESFFVPSVRNGVSGASAMTNIPDSHAVQIGDIAIPIFAAGPVWAIANLVISIVGMGLAAVVVLRIYLQKKAEVRDDSEKQQRRRYVPITLVMVFALLATATFLLTQNMRNQTALTDWWTSVHAGLLLAQIVAYTYAFRPKAKGMSKESVAAASIAEESSMAERVTVAQVARILTPVVERIDEGEFQ